MDILFYLLYRNIDTHLGPKIQESERKKSPISSLHPGLGSARKYSHRTKKITNIVAIVVLIVCKRDIANRSKKADRRGIKFLQLLASFYTYQVHFYMHISNDIVILLAAVQTFWRPWKICGSIFYDVNIVPANGQQCELPSRIHFFLLQFVFISDIMQR